MKIRSMQSGDTQMIWRLAKTGDVKAQEDLVRAYQARIAGFVYTFLGTSEGVEDLCQQIFVNALVALPGLKDLNQVESWLFRIARNACLSYLRKQKFRRLFVPFLGEQHEVHEPEPEVDHTEELAWLRREIKELPSAQKELVALLQDQSLSYEELAKITGRSVSSVKSLLFRARETLKRKSRYARNE